MTILSKISAWGRQALQALWYPPMMMYRALHYGLLVVRAIQIQRCERCEQVGHSVENCPLCKYCKGLGHDVLDCPRNCDKSCYRCGAAGHLRVDCPRLVRYQVDNDSSEEGPYYYPATDRNQNNPELNVIEMNSTPLPNAPGETREESPALFVRSRFGCVTIASRDLPEEDWETDPVQNRARLIARVRPLVREVFALPVTPEPPVVDPDSQVARRGRRSGRGRGRWVPPIVRPMPVRGFRPIEPPVQRIRVEDIRLE